MKKRVLAILAAAAMAATTFTVPVFAEEEEPVTLTYWGWDSNYYQPVIDAYMESHPNVKIEATATEWGDMLTKAQQALASGSELPTIIPMDITLIGNWKKMGITENLLDYGLDTSKYNPALIEAATDDEGKVIGLFENVCPAGIAYKRDLAKEYFGTVACFAKLCSIYALEQIHHYDDLLCSVGRCRTNGCGRFCDY